MLSIRLVRPEMLDHLSPEDPRAIKSRRDLVRVNALMLQPRIMARALSAFYERGAPRTILDLGAGDGVFMLRVASLLAPQWRDVTVVLFDQTDIVNSATREAFRALHWRVETMTGDLFDALERKRMPPSDVVTANLFLHHFTNVQLSLLFRHVVSLTRLFVACEPRRSLLAWLSSSSLWVIGCNDVSQHDAPASVEAGFRGNELSALWPKSNDWVLSERGAGLFSHCFAAARSREGI